VQTIQPEPHFIDQLERRIAVPSPLEKTRIRRNQVFVFLATLLIAVLLTASTQIVPTLTAGSRRLVVKPAEDHYILRAGGGLSNETRSTESPDAERLVQFANGAEGRLVVIKSPLGTDYRYLRISADLVPTLEEIWTAVWGDGAELVHPVDSIELKAGFSAQVTEGKTARGSLASAITWEQRGVIVVVSSEASLHELATIAEEFSVQ
jgi:hypothetical protein